ncbi:MAG: hypothetical protein HY698_01830 [Deltaproteobacteria bacterium]|nr:hypothetical protein [Deltaproteobacteria bacterium]
MSSSGPKARAPRPTKAGRIADFLGEMFPPIVHLPASLTSVAAIYFSLAALEGRMPLTLTWRAGGAALTLFLFGLLMRLYDELKDVETDLRLGRAGDPRYMDRPIVTGRIRVEDLDALRVAVSVAALAVNLPLGFPLPLAVFAGVFLLCWLSFKWFFWPAISRNILLAFVTHNPIAAALGLYVVAVYTRDFGLTVPWQKVLLLIMGLWLPVAAWETSRKVRCPEDETDYQTYSKKLGWRTAGLVPAVFVIGAVAFLVPVLRAAGLGGAAVLGLAVAAAIPVVACLRFRLRPTTASANLRPFVEIFALLVNLGLPLALALEHGVGFR